MFVPAVAGEVALGRLLTQFMPHPGLVAVVCFAPATVVMVIIGMLIGATIWLSLPGYSGHIFSQRSTRPSFL
jgi:hypothetical protein